MPKKTKYSGGDCYVKSFEFVMDEQLRGDKGWILVHGIATLTGGPHEGKEFGHAWAEKGEDVYDGASGKTVPKVLYYAIGNITYTHKYSWDEAKKLAVDTGTYGAWDEKVLQALHS